MKITFDIREPKKIEARLIAEMSIEQWLELDAFLTNARTEQIKDGEYYYHPANQLHRAIHELLSDANRVFYFNVEEKPDEEKTDPE